MNSQPALPMGGATGVNRRGPPGMPCAEGASGAGGTRRAEKEGPAIPRFRRGALEGGAFRSLQAVDREERPDRAFALGPAGLRVEAPGPHRPGGGETVVRCVQPDFAGRRQPHPGHSPADHEFRDRVRPHRNEPDAGGEEEPTYTPHALPVARRDRSPARRPRRARGTRDREPEAGRHCPAPPAHRMPPGQDRAAPLVGSPGRRAPIGRQQDRPAKGSSQFAGATDSGQAAARTEPVRVSLAARPIASSQPCAGSRPKRQ